IAALVRDLQEAERGRDAARLALAAEQAKPVEERGKLIEAALAKQAEEAAAKAAALRQELQASHPDYVRCAEPRRAALEALQHRREPDEAFLAFVIGRDAGYAVVVRRDHLAARPLAITASVLAQSVADLRKAFLPRLGALADYDLRGAH